MRGIYSISLIGEYVFVVIEEEFRVNEMALQEFTLVIFPTNLEREVARFPCVFYEHLLPMPEKSDLHVTNGGLLIRCPSSLRCSFFYVDGQGVAKMKTFPFDLSCNFQRVFGNFATFYADGRIYVYDIEREEETKLIDVRVMKLYKGDTMFSALQESTGDVYFVGKTRVTGEGRRYEVCLYRCNSESDTLEKVAEIERRNICIECRLEWMSQDALCLFFDGYYIKYVIRDRKVICKHEIHDATIFSRNCKVVDERYIISEGSHGMQIFDTIACHSQHKYYKNAKIEWPQESETKRLGYHFKSGIFFAACLDKADDTMYCWAHPDSDASGNLRIMHSEGNVQLLADGTMRQSKDGITESRHGIREIREPIYSPGKITFGKKSYELFDVDGWKSAFAEMKDLQETRSDYSDYSCPFRNLYKSYGRFISLRPKRNFDVFQTIQHLKRKNHTKALSRDVLEVIQEHVKKMTVLPKIKI